MCVCATRYEEAGYYNAEAQGAGKPGGDPGTSLLPLVYQSASNKSTVVLEQPLDFTYLAEKYACVAPHRVACPLVFPQSESVKMLHAVTHRSEVN